MNFTKNRIADKSPQEREFDKLNETYTEIFGKPYRFSIGIDVASWDETLTDIRRCIESGKPQAEPEYIEGMIY